MHKAILAAVGLLLLSVAALSLPAAGAEAGESAESGGSRYAALAGGAALASTGGVGNAAPARRGRPLALPGIDSVGSPLLAALGGLLVLLLGGGALLLRRGSSSAKDRTAADAGGEQVGRDGVPATSPPTRGGSSEDGSPPVRTDEEYVVQLLIANHGRMRQARIVEETDWSKAKVSRLLSRMEERDQIVRERAGREKIVQLADANTSIPL